MAPEAEITINGQPLTLAQSMTLRVALTRFHADLADSEYCEKLGKIGQLYWAGAWEVLKIIIEPPRDLGIRAQVRPGRYEVKVP